MYNLPQELDESHAKQIFKILALMTLTAGEMWFAPFHKVV